MFMALEAATLLSDFTTFMSSHKDIVGLILFGICIAFFIWDKLPMSVTAIGGCVLMVFFGVSDFSTVFGQFASKTVVLLISIMVVGNAVAETGLAKKVGNILTKLSGNKEWKILLVSYLLAAGLSIFLTNATVLAIFMPIIVGLSKTNKNIKPMNLIIPITLASNMGGLMTLISSSQQMTAQGILESLDIVLYGDKQMMFNTLDFLPFGIVLVVAGLLYCLFIGLRLGNKIWGDRDDSDCEIEVKELKDSSKGKNIAMSIIIITMFVLFIFNKQIGIDTTIVAVIAALACIITKCIGVKPAFASVNWNIVLRLGGCLGIVKAIEKAGSTKILSDGIIALGIDKLSPFLIFAVAVLLAQLASLVISNSTSITLLLTIVIAMPLTLKLNPQAFAMGITLGASMGMCCPLSGSTWGMSMSAGYKFKDYFKYGVLFDAICYVLIIAIIPLLFPITL